ncbi:hypothetical protein PPTG_21089 [Phytophthora nicotianae INRA-310]|uniref:Uncharacterized protein n=4 Tax=Phytophthora nicotianae TaxID=4792 RepID=W2R9V6_PHYN3|nr:hypothetical protein PPTG_21089 [Phytophthora nicotianae INRA-310]ETN21489.1 hypothetical protein PPTG_21089 [Phytophthora nicotianae INRA-310]
MRGKCSFSDYDFTDADDVDVTKCVKPSASIAIKANSGKKSFGDKSSSKTAHPTSATPTKHANTNTEETARRYELQKDTRDGEVASPRLTTQLTMSDTFMKMTALAAAVTMLNKRTSRPANARSFISPLKTT